MNTLNLTSQAWILHGIIRSTSGELTLCKERLSFTDDAGKIVFDAPIGEVSNLSSPWNMFGGGISFTISADKYRVTFVRPGNTSGAEGNFGDVAVGREACAKWKSALGLS